MAWQENMQAIWRRAGLYPKMRYPRTLYPRTLYPKLILLIGASTLVIGATMAFTVGRIVTSIALEVGAENLEARLADRSAQIKDLLTDPPALAATIGDLTRADGRLDWVVGRGSEVLISGDGTGRSASAELLRRSQSLLAADAGAAGTSNVWQRRVTAVVRLDSELRLAVSYRPKVPKDRRWSLLRIPANALGAALICVVLFSWLLAQPMHRRLDMLQRAIGDYGQGNKQARVPNSPPSHELSSVFDAFNAMADRIAVLETAEEQHRRAQRELMAGLAHDINTPITVIRGYGEHLLDSRTLSAKQAEMVSDLTVQSLYVQALVDDLLTLTSEVDGRIPLVRQEVVIDHLIDSLVDTFAPAAERRKVALFGDGRGLRVSADPHRLKQILTNLIRNALSHAQGATWIEIDARQVAGGIEITVEDDGPGVPAEQVATLFEAYRRGDKASAPGWGIGLAIVKRLVVAHGGSVRYVGDRPGACLQITLPTVIEELG